MRVMIRGLQELVRNILQHLYLSDSFICSVTLELPGSNNDAGQEALQSS